MDVADDWIDGWTGTGASRVADRKPSGASDGKPSRAEVAGTRARAGTGARAGVPLTSPPPLEYGVPMYEADDLVVPPEGEQVEGG
jgi:hypothetical protein